MNVSLTRQPGRYGSARERNKAIVNSIVYLYSIIMYSMSPISNIIININIAKAHK